MASSHSVQAVVLRVMDYREFDLIVTLFTPRAGKLSALARGAKKSKKRGLNVLQPFALLEVALSSSPRSRMLALESADLVRPLRRLAEDPLLLGFAGHHVEIVNAFTREMEHVPGAWELLVASLEDLDRGRPKPGRLRVFELLALDLFGFRPNLESCTACGREATGGGWMDPRSGGYVCPRCAARHPAPFRAGAGTLGLLRAVCKLGTESLDRVSFTKKSLVESREMLPRFVEYTLGSELRSLRYVRALGGDKAPSRGRSLGSARPQRPR